MGDIGFPGEFPFARGIQPTMYRGRLWTMRQYAGFGTAAESNARYRYLLTEGVDGLSVGLALGIGALVGLFAFALSVQKKRAERLFRDGTAAVGKVKRLSPPLLKRCWPSLPYTPHSV